MMNKRNEARTNDTRPRHRRRGTDTMVGESSEFISFRPRFCSWCSAGLLLAVRPCRGQKIPSAFHRFISPSGQQKRYNILHNFRIFFSWSASTSTTGALQISSHGLRTRSSGGWTPLPVLGERDRFQDAHLYASADLPGLQHLQVWTAPALSS